MSGTYSISVGSGFNPKTSIMTCVITQVFPQPDVCTFPALMISVHFDSWDGIERIRRKNIGVHKGVSGSGALGVCVRIPLDWASNSGDAHRCSSRYVGHALRIDALQSMP